MTTIDYEITDDWATGFVAQVSIAGTPDALDGWIVEFEAAFAITNIWNAEIVSHTGTHYVVRNAPWNAAVPAGGALSFGFQATPGPSGGAIDHFAINGQGIAETTLPTLSVSDATILEGDSGTGSLTFTVTMSGAASAPVSVTYATADGSARGGQDYAGASGILSFAAGESRKTVTIAVTGDRTAEANETFLLKLSQPHGAVLGDDTGIATIRDDDAVPPGGSGATAFSTSGNQIVDAHGTPVQIAGVNWFGLESPNLAPHGLWARGYQDMMDQMVSLGFNTIRLPFSSELLHNSAQPNGIDFAKNPDLQYLTGLEIMDKIVAYADAIGLRIILDHHRSDAGAGASANGLWYDAQHSEAQWIADWQMLATRYASNPSVIGADLHNEPYNGTWGGGGPTDWAAAAERAGNAIGQVNPGWLILVEGVGTYQGSSYWWGGNLMGVKDRPIQLDQPGKLVYSAHDYPNSVYAQPWFQAPDFAKDLPAKFDQMWGYIYKQGIAPVLIGEFGSKLEDPKDIPWIDALTAYLAGDLDTDGMRDIPAGALGPSWTYWSWNPNSGDTGGILQNDWQHVDEAKLARLLPIEFAFGDGSLQLAGGDGKDVLDGGVGDDVVLGGAGHDILNGHDGNDRLDGGAGADHMIGGTGNDTYVVDHPRDVVVEAAQAGVDTVVTSRADYKLGSNLENLVLAATVASIGKGNDEDNAIVGNTGADRLFGLSGNDTLMGGQGDDTLDGGIGQDKMAGGEGDDLYLVDDPADAVSEAGGSGVDTVKTSLLHFTLSDGVENLVMTGNAAMGIGSASANQLTGGAGGDILAGLGGNDILRGGRGNDRLLGGSGNDTLTSGAGRDLVVLARGGGADVVTDFTDRQDRLDVTAYGYHSLDDLGKAGGSIGTVADGTLIVLDRAGDQVLLTGVAAGLITAADFLFA
jgi:aryl-phospho-beta-D-glucosidase BglC (GH1 family)